MLASLAATDFGSLPWGPALFHEAAHCVSYSTKEEIVEDLEAALEQFRMIAEDLK